MPRTNCTEDTDCLGVLGTICYGDLTWNDFPFTCQCHSWFGWHEENCQGNSFTTYILFVFNSLNAVICLAGVCMCISVIIRNFEYASQQNALLWTTIWSLCCFIALFLWNVGVVLNSNAHEISYVGPDGQAHAAFQPMVVHGIVIAAIFLGLALVHVSLVWITLGKLLANKNPFDLYFQKVATIFIEVVFVAVFLVLGIIKGTSYVLIITAQAYAVFCMIVHYVGSTLVTKQLLRCSDVLFTGEEKQNERKILKESVAAIRSTAFLILWSIVIFSVFGIASIIMSIGGTTSADAGWKEFAPTDANTWKPIVMTNLGIEIILPFANWFMILYCHKMTLIEKKRSLRGNAACTSGGENEKKRIVKVQLV
mmetsp:Transcript_21483/g.27448  ORF Transcript_21483/g.27448 Transcript_21483/m.27448 type:complete len:367 (+) Transcript_21483:172-1272(+)